MCFSRQEQRNISWSRDDDDDDVEGDRNRPFLSLCGVIVAGSKPEANKEQDIIIIITSP